MSTPKTTWIQWFEIPVSDFDRAKAFYEQIFAIEMEINDLGELKMGVFPHQTVGGAICYHPQFYHPGQQGPLLYLDANPDLAIVEARIETAGGQVVISKRQISPEHGFMCVFMDTEGNRLALHSDQ